MKEPKCKFCGGKHYQTFCSKKPRKPIKAKAVLRTKKPLKPVKRSHIKPQGKSERSKAIRQLDSIFSRYIRLKDSINGLARCVTCGTVLPWREMQNGHYISRRILGTRWNTMNCNVQCSMCNVTLGGNLKTYRTYLINKYGIVKVLELERSAQTAHKITTSEMRTMIEHYTALVNAM